MNLKEPAWVWPSSGASSPAMGDASGRKHNPTKARRFISPCQNKNRSCSNGSWLMLAQVLGRLTANVRGGRRHSEANRQRCQSAQTQVRAPGQLAGLQRKVRQATQ